MAPDVDTRPSLTAITSITWSTDTYIIRMEITAMITDP